MSNYHINKERARTINTVPTQTDQSQANDTDVNVIVKKYKVTGQVRPGNQPLYGDFASLPTDLRGILEKSRGMQKLRHQLPAQLREKPIEELLMMTDDDLVAILKPSETTSTTTTTGDNK